MAKKKNLDDGFTPLERIFGITVAEAQARYDTLTPREREVADLIAKGHRNKKISEQLELAMKTLDIHRAKLYWKLGVNTISGVANVVNLLAVNALSPST